MDVVIVVVDRISIIGISILVLVDAVIVIVVRNERDDLVPKILPCNIAMVHVSLGIRDIQMAIEPMLADVGVQKEDVFIISLNFIGMFGIGMFLVSVGRVDNDLATIYNILVVIEKILDCIAIPEDIVTQIRNRNRRFRVLIYVVIN